MKTRPVLICVRCGSTEDDVEPCVNCGKVVCDRCFDTTHFDGLQYLCPDKPPTLVLSQGEAP